jgi:hypothetical protein
MFDAIFFSGDASLWRAERAFDERDAQGLIDCIVNDAANSRLLFVRDYRYRLRDAGIYEPSLFFAFFGKATTNRGWPVGQLHELFDFAETGRLRACGDVIERRRLNIYRVVSGSPAERDECGFSWTASLECACWYALRNPHRECPKIQGVAASSNDFLCFSNKFGEQEAVIYPEMAKVSPKSAPYLEFDAVTMRTNAAKHEKKRVQERTPSTASSRGRPARLTEPAVRVPRGHHGDARRRCQRNSSQDVSGDATRS